MSESRMCLEFFHDGDRWFFYPLESRADFAFVDEHPFLIDLAELAGPWPDGLDGPKICDVIYRRFRNDQDTTICVRSVAYRVDGYFGYFAGGVDMQRFGLVPIEGVNHEG